MHSFFALVLALQSIVCVHAALYVIEPSSGSTCHGGEACTVQWLDDGEAPLLTSFGVCTVGLYTADMQLVQTIEPLDVTSSHSLTFRPNPEAGPNSDTYYIAFTSTDDNDGGLLAFSPFFRLDQMSGSFSSPLDEATTTFPLPRTTGTSNDSDSTLATITVGTLDTSRPALTSLSATTPFSTSSQPTTRLTRTSSPVSPSGSPTSVGVAAPSETANGSYPRTHIISPSLLGVLSLCFLLVSVL